MRKRTVLPVAAMLFVAMVGLSLTQAHAASINYGNFSLPADGITFGSVTESSATDGVPLFGAPDPYVVGLDFDPMGFAASANGGAMDITDGQLNFTVEGLVTQTGGVGIASLNLVESGDYTLAGAGTSLTSVLAGASIRIKVLEVDGAPISPLSLPQSNASVGFNLVANSGVVQPWSLGTGVDIAALLAGMNVPYTIGATKIEVVIDNALTAISEASSLGFIAKKDFAITVTPDLEGVIPEPTSAALIGLAGFGMLLRRRAR